MVRVTKKKAQPKSGPLQSDILLSRLNALHPKAIDLSLGRTRNLLEKLNNPEKLLKSVVHIAGTNGKGSTLAFIKSICEKSGLKVNCYTSPHLIRFAERIYLSGQNIAETTLSLLLEECEEANAGSAITLFEITTAAAFLAFSRSPADITLIETGLGGRFDATNVIEDPLLTIITPISKDHTDWLGNTITKIAFEKAGILKPGGRALIGPQMREANDVIKNQAKKLGVETIRYGKDWRVSNSMDGFTLSAKDFNSDFPRPSLLGEHQVINSATAVMASKLLTKSVITNNFIREGLISASWEGRLQNLQGLSTKGLPQGWSLWLDGGHNPGAAKALTKVISQWQDKPIHLIFGYMKSRDPKEFLRPMKNYIETLHAIDIPGEQSSLKASECKFAAQELGISATKSNSFLEAIKEITVKSKKPSRILICGSLYLVGDVLKYETTGFDR